MKKPERKTEKKPEAVKVNFDTVNEAILMAAVITDEKARKKYINLPTDYFFGPSHGDMWAAIQELYKRGLEYDTPTIQQIAGEKFDADVLDTYISEYPVSTANLKHHVNNLRWDKTRHEISRGILPLFIEAIRDPSTDPDRLKSLAKQVSDSFGGVGELQYLRSAANVVRSHTHELTARREGHALYPFGFDALDFYTENDGDKAGKPRMIPGLAPGLLTALTGLFGSGKTSFTANLVIEQVKRKRKVLWGAWEQQPEMSLELAAAISLGFSRTEIQTGQYSEEDQKDLENEMERLGEYVQFFELPFNRSKGDKGESLNDRNMDTIHQYVAESGCNLFIGDVFGYALREKKPDDEDMAIKRMKGVATQCKTHVLLVTHLNLKQVESRQDKRPTRASVMGTSAWINGSDNCIAIHAPGLFDPVPIKTLEAHVLKQRHGLWPQTIQWDWNPEFVEMTNGRTFEMSSKTNEEDVVDFLNDKKDKPRKWNK